MLRQAVSQAKSVDGGGHFSSMTGKVSCSLSRCLIGSVVAVGVVAAAWCIFFSGDQMSIYVKVSTRSFIFVGGIVSCFQA